MSERDEGVRKLAEEIAEMSRAWGVAPAGNVEEKILAFLAEREASLQAQLHRALGELTGLRGAMERAFKVGGNLEYKAVDALLRSLDIMKAALSAPLSERAGEVLSELENCRKNPGCDWTGFEPLMDKMDALRAELGKGGEGG